MPVAEKLDFSRPRDERRVKVYENRVMDFWHPSETALEAARRFRREAAGDVAFWAVLKAAIGRFAKEEQRRAQRREKAATVLLRHYEDVGKKDKRAFPAEMAEELDAAIGAMYRADGPDHQDYPFIANEENLK